MARIRSNRTTGSRSADELLALARRRGNQIRRRRRGLVVATGGGLIACGLALALTPLGQAPMKVNVIGPSTSTQPPQTAFTPTTTAPSANSTSTVPSTTSNTQSGVFAGTFRFNVVSMAISPNGRGTATWLELNKTIGHGSFHLLSVSGRNATGVVDTSSDSTRWSPGSTFTLTLQPNDMLIVRPSGPFPSMCGATAYQANRLSCGA